MPSLGSHLAAARILADRLAHQAVDADRGSFYLGSTAPDIRVLTRLDRGSTHFFDLDDLERQDSVARLFKEHAALRDAASLDTPTRAFMAGYLTHLVMDEQYIERIYRRFFGANSSLADDPRRNALDRVLQYEMNRRELTDVSTMAEIREVLAHTSVDADVQFIANETLRRWRDVVTEIASQPPTWDRFPQMMDRHLARAGYSEQEIEEFCRHVPEMLAETLDHVTEPHIREFLDVTMDRSLDRLREYLL